MKNAILSAALLATVLTGCIKGDDANYKQYVAVRPGITLHDCATTQNRAAVEPGMMAMRMAMLVAEAVKQSSSTDLSTLDLTNLKYNSIGVKNALLGSQTGITLLNNVYTLAFNESATVPDGSYLGGSITIATGGKSLGESGAQWTIDLSDFKIVATSVTYKFSQGTTTLTNNGGAISFSMSNMAIYMTSDGSSSTALTSSWSGTFSVKMADASLAYSLCTGKLYDVTGSASGTTFYSFLNNSTPTELFYKVEDGKFLSTYQLGGTEICRFTGLSDYDMSVYPANYVTYEYSYTTTTTGLYSRKCVVSYNGNTYNVN